MGVSVQLLKGRSFRWFRHEIRNSRSMSYLCLLLSPSSKWFRSIRSIRKRLCRQKMSCQGWQICLPRHTPVGLSRYRIGRYLHINSICIASDEFDRIQIRGYPRSAAVLTLSGEINSLLTRESCLQLGRNVLNEVEWHQKRSLGVLKAVFNEW